MRLILCSFLLLFVNFVSYSQFKQKTIKLTKELNEVSGIAKINDSVFATINDSGNEPCVFFINLSGKILHKSTITNATNIDWEDIIINDSILYIADVGNNNSDRKDLCVYSIDLKHGWQKDSMPCQKIEFSYQEQTAFPPSEGSIKFDCEAFYFGKGKLNLVAKSIDEPWRGTSRIYPLPIIPGKYSIQSSGSIYIPSKTWMEGAVTSCSVYDSILTILTYNKLVELDKINLNSHKSTYKFGKTLQREGLCRIDENTFVIVSEKHRILGGPFLTILTRKK